MDECIGGRKGKGIYDMSIMGWMVLYIIAIFDMLCKLEYEADEYQLNLVLIILIKRDN